jgi:hypothetical protein
METKDTINLNVPHTGEAYVSAVLTDQLGELDTPKIPAKINCRGGAIFVHIDGYGDSCSPDNQAYPIAIEIADGELRVVVWGDINQEDPTHIIPLTKAKENLRIEE